jgi:CubicO group peptidase (beta-lactamase class C family)
MTRPHTFPGAGWLCLRLSRRATLRCLGAGLAIAALRSGSAARFAAAQVETLTAGPPATPGAAQASPLPDLTGVELLPLTGERRATFEAYVAAKLAELRVPGAAVAVVQGGEVAFLQGFGVRELGRPVPVTADTLLRIGSVTKSFSSLLAATLVDAGRLSWETPLVDLLPTFAVTDAALTPHLTVRDAFCACTGLPRRDLEFMLNAQALTPERLIADMARLPLTAPFGEKYQYSNQMVAAGGFAAAVADGGSPDDLSYGYAIALRERVLNPIGMPRTTDALAEVVAGNDYAVPHAEDITGALHPLPLMVDDTWLVPVAPSGVLWSSARELVRYVQTELGRGVAPDGVRVVSEANLERTWQPGVTFPSAPDAPPTLAASVGYGLGWGVGAYGGQRLINHSGATLGFTSLVTFLPDADLGLVILTNGTGVAGQFTNAVQMRLLELLFDQPAATDARLTSFLTAADQQRAELLAHLGQVDPAVVTPFLGHYANADLGDLTLTLRAGTLLLTVGAFQSALRPQRDADASVTAYLPVDPPFGEGGISPTPMTISLQRGADGRRQVLLTTEGDDGTDLVYVYEPVGAAATPAP